MKRKIIPFFYLLFGTLTLLSCKDEVVSTITEESVKDVEGTWKIVSLTRNGEELVNRIDCSKFRITFKGDGTYTLLDKLAFAVSGPGTYKLSDPRYPYSLVLTQQNQSAETIKFQFPVVAGNRQLSLTFSQGCSGNTYQYNFIREN